ncbi:hypothetical protein [Chromobacterium sp. CV08]|uniref:hypothetical protein n=1 Tax=Chromobacterium sp. CV08 TaxID=3133274 RepID=UPI003DA932FE
MPITASLSRAASCPDLSALHAGAGAPRTGLARQLSAAEGRAGTPPARALSDGDLAGYQAGFVNRSLEALFASAGSADALRDVYHGSNNVYAKLEVAEFAKVYHQLSRQPGLSAEARGVLDGQARRYAEQILKDGLGERSAFGPWTPKTAKGYQLRSALERQLGQFAGKHLAGDAAKLGDAMMRDEVMPFVRQYLEHQLGGRLSEDALRQLCGVFDRAAFQAFEALREARGHLQELHGLGVGKLARDLDTVAVLPLLLRNVLAQLAPPPPNGARPEPPAAAEPTGDNGPTPPQAGGVTINIGDIHIDNSRHTDNSRRVVHRHGGRRRGDGPTPLAVSLRLRQDGAAQRADSGRDRGAERAGNRSVGVDAATGRETGVSKSGVDASTQTTAGAGRSSVVDAPRDAGVQAGPVADAPTPGPAALPFATWRSYYPEAVLRSVGFQQNGDAHPAARALVTDLRNALRLNGGELGAVPAQAALVAVRDGFLREAPGRDGASQPYRQPLDDGQWETLRGALDAHPQHDQLRGQVQRLARLTNLTGGDWPADSAVARLLDWARPTQDARQAPPAPQPSLAATEPAGDLAGAGLDFAPMRELPTAAYLRSLQFISQPRAAGDLLLGTLRGALQVDPATPAARRADFEKSRDALLPSFNRGAVLDDFAAGRTEKLEPALERLLPALERHPQREKLAGFARQMARDTALLRGGEPNPLLSRLFGALGLDAAEEAARRPQPAAASDVILTVDGQHVNAAAVRERGDAKR